MMSFRFSVIYCMRFVNLLVLLLRLCLCCWCLVRAGRTKLSFSLFPLAGSFLIGKRTLLDNLTLPTEHYDVTVDIANLLSCSNSQSADCLSYFLCAFDEQRLKYRITI